MLILRFERAMVAFKAFNPIEAITRGPGADIEYRQYGAIQGWVAIIRATDNVDTFVAEIKARGLFPDASGTSLRRARRGSRDGLTPKKWRDFLIA